MQHFSLGRAQESGGPSPPPPQLISSGVQKPPASAHAGSVSGGQALWHMPFTQHMPSPKEAPQPQSTPSTAPEPRGVAATAASNFGSALLLMVITEHPHRAGLQ